MGGASGRGAGIGAAANAPARGSCTPGHPRLPQFRIHALSPSPSASAMTRPAPLGRPVALPSGPLPCASACLPSLPCWPQSGHPLPCIFSPSSVWPPLYLAPGHPLLTPSSPPLSPIHYYAKFSYNDRFQELDVPRCKVISL